LPLSGRLPAGTFLIGDDPAQPGEAGYAPASPGYFAAMNIPLLRGRLFDRGDTVNSQHVAVISQSLARRYWPNADPIGQRIQFGSMDTDRHQLQIVGIVGDVRQALDAEPGPMVYACAPQRPQWWQAANLSIVLRANGQPQELMPSMRAAVDALRPGVPTRFRTLDQVFSSSLDQRRFILTLFGVFSCVGLLIAASGVYAVMAYAVAQRTREFGIRMALGAARADVLRLTLGLGMTPAAIGIAIGVPLALVSTSAIRSLLFGVAATDLLTFVVTTLAVMIVSLLACAIPARRAARLAPSTALRCD
jgi:predicted permease